MVRLTSVHGPEPLSVNLAGKSAVLREADNVSNDTDDLR
jgi:hypothetical protein